MAFCELKFSRDKSLRLLLLVASAIEISSSDCSNIFAQPNQQNGIPAKGTKLEKQPESLGSCPEELIRLYSASSPR